VTAPRESTNDPVADLRAAADAIREDHPHARQAGRFWPGIADLFDRAAERMQFRPHTIHGQPGGMTEWNQTVQAARGYLDHGAADARGRRS
jgi:hypothetical protein